MLTWNDILDIELRNKDNPDVATLIAAIRAGDFDDVFRVAVTECVEDIRSDLYVHEDHGDYLENDRDWKKLVAICELEK